MDRTVETVTVRSKRHQPQVIEIIAKNDEDAYIPEEDILQEANLGSPPSAVEIKTKRSGVLSPTMSDG